MYDYMRSNGIPTDRKETKLTQLLNTNGKHIVITSYYLWFLLDYCYFEIDDVQEMYVFTRNTAFNVFVREFMDKKTIVVVKQEKLFYKLIMNSSYGGDGMNREKFTSSAIVNEDAALIRQLAPNFVNTEMMTPEIKDSEGKIIKYVFYQVEQKPKSFGCDSCLANFVFTLNIRNIGI
jgi:hypothetical protein